MGREIKRVPLDFNWPLNEVWQGYLAPDWPGRKDCEVCGGTGSSPAYKLFADKWYGYVAFDPSETGSRPFSHSDQVIREAAARSIGYRGGLFRECCRLADLFNSTRLHHISAEDFEALKKEGRLPENLKTAEDVNRWSIHGFGHDSINMWICAKAHCERLGVSHECAHCDGEGELWDSPEEKAASEAWERTEPPTGPGYQLWETVSEGSPTTPVFEKPEDLADWIVKHGWEADRRTSKESWLRFIGDEMAAFSFVATEGGEVMTGVEFLARNQ